MIVLQLGKMDQLMNQLNKLAALRAMPNLSVIRPADGNETAAAWKLAIESTNKPTALILTRQDLPTLKGTVQSSV